MTQRLSSTFGAAKASQSDQASPTFDMEVAGIPFSVDTPSGAWVQKLAPLYASFPRVLPEPWQVALTLDPGLQNITAPWIVHEEPVTRFRIDCYAGWIDMEHRQAAVSVPSWEAATPGLERTIAYVCMQVLPRYHNSLLLHAAGIIWQGQGLIISGPSRAGKTTTANLSLGYGELLNDEMMVVDLSGSQPLMHSTPFVGRRTPPELIRRTRRSTPARALLLLQHWPDFELIPLSPAEAVMELLRTDMIAVDRLSSAKAWMAVAEDLVAAVPAFRLRLLPTVELWDFLARELPVS